MKKTIFLLLFVLPFLAVSQVDSPVVEGEDMPVFEDNDVYPDEEAPTAKVEIPAYFKKNKAMKYCSDFRHCGFVLNDSILIPLIYSDAI